MMQNEWKRILRTLSVFLAVASLAMTLSQRMVAQDDDDDPPSRAARFAHLDGSISFQPAGESEWVDAVPNRPMTTGDKLWADRDSRAEVELGSTSIRLNGNTGISFLNLDDRTVQIQLSSGAISVRVRRLSHDDVFEIDTPNQAFSIFQPGSYRLEASEDGSNTIVSVREGEGESTGNGQTFTVHAGQQATFSGSDRLNADVQQIGGPDNFDRWSDARDHRFEHSRSSRYVSHDVVGAEDLDEYGDWDSSPEYGNVWYPRVEVGWAPYHTGHWAWIDPWGWTWVDDAPWGYAPFHYGRWAFVGHRWGWVPGPVDVRPVYAPALVVFVGGRGPALGGNVAWFPLGPREVYVPSYHVSPAYVNRVNISNTTVNQTTITNVYNTTVINKTTVVNNVTYVNRNVSGAVTAVPQRGFAGGQPVSRIAVRVDRRELETASVSSRVAVAPSQTAVLGVHDNRSQHAVAPPRAVFNREVIAKTVPPPAPVSFADKQHDLAAHPGQPVARQEMQRLRPSNVPQGQPLVRQAPPGKPALVDMAHPGNRPAYQPASEPVNPRAAQPGNRPVTPPGLNDRTAVSPMANRPQPEQPNRPSERNQPNHPFEPPARNDRPVPQPNNRPEANSPASNQPSERNSLNRPVASAPRNDRAPDPPAAEVRPAQPSRYDGASSGQHNQPAMEHPQPRAASPAAPQPQHSQPAPPQAAGPKKQTNNGQKQDKKK